MKNSILQITIGLAIILIVGVLVYTNKKSYIPELVQTVTPQATTTVATTTTATTTSVSVSVSQPPKPTGITFAQVAEHNSRTSCWSVVNGNVYDLTS